MEIFEVRDSLNNWTPSVFFPEYGQAVRFVESAEYECRVFHHTVESLSINYGEEFFFELLNTYVDRLGAPLAARMKTEEVFLEREDLRRDLEAA